MREHLDLACIKLNNTQETTRKLEEKFEALQRQLAKKVDTDKEGGNKRFIWKISNGLLVSGRGRPIGEKESNAFYTGCYGYKLKLKLSPDSNSGSFKSFKIVVVLIKGEYDDILPWPFSKKITVTIIKSKGGSQRKEKHYKIFKPEWTCVGKYILRKTNFGQFGAIRWVIAFLILRRTSN